MATESTAELLAEIAAPPGSRLVVGVVGVGGSGKTVLLDRIEFEARSVGIEVVRRGAGIPHRVGGERHGDATPEPGARRVVLMDDVHHLDDDALDVLLDVARNGSDDLVVAFRPRAQTPPWRGLVSVLERLHPLVSLGTLDPERIEERMRAATGSASRDRVLEVARITGGVPGLVERILPLHGSGEEPFGDRPAELAAIAQLGREIATLDPRVRQLFLLVAVGGDPGLWRSRAQSDTDVDDILAEAQAMGLMTDDGSLVPLARSGLLAVTPVHRVRAVQRGIVDALEATGQPLDRHARMFARDGLVDPRIAAVLEREGDRLLPTAPSRAGELYDEAIAAGCDPRSLAARRAQVAWALGDLDVAGRAVDEHMNDDAALDRDRAIDVGAAVWASRGMLARSSELYQWHGAGIDATSASFAAVAKIGTGDKEGAEQMLTAAESTSPTVLAVAASLMARGLRDSLEESGTRALPSLIRSSDMMTASGAVVPAPESPAAIAALVAIHGGDLGVADSVLSAALDGGQGGASAKVRLLLIQGWVAMLADRADEARARIEEVNASPGGLAARDRALLGALEVGIARRADAVAELAAAWRRAHDSTLHVPIDLFGILPLGELVIAAARLGERERVGHRLHEAWELLARLGEPALWSVPLHWACVQAAILDAQPQDLAPDAAALVRASGYSRPASVMAAAGRAWLDILSGHVDVAEVDEAARALATVGLGWDGARMAGHAAARAADRKDMSRLLACARELRRAPDPGPVEGPGPEGPGARLDGGSGRPELSSREREVALLVLRGKSYREVGEAIFISPRTVEHHMERIRRRLAVTSRSELLAQLRMVLGADEGPA